VRCEQGDGRQDLQTARPAFVLLPGNSYTVDRKSMPVALFDATARCCHRDYIRRKGLQENRPAAAQLQLDVPVNLFRACRRALREKPATGNAGFRMIRPPSFLGR
jgi:hypothetical protein